MPLHILKLIPPHPDLFEAVLYDMRNSWESWDKAEPEADVGLAQRLQRAGDSHGKWARQVAFYMRIDAPDYWWRQMDTYAVGVAPGDVTQNSTSIMHAAGKRDFVISDFADPIDPYILRLLNNARHNWIEGGRKRGDIWWRSIVAQMPMSFRYIRGMSLNYMVARHIARDRRNHRLDEWATFVEALRRLPSAEELIFKDL